MGIVLAANEVLPTPRPSTQLSRDAFLSSLQRTVPSNLGVALLVAAVLPRFETLFPLPQGSLRTDDRESAIPSMQNTLHRYTYLMQHSMEPIWECFNRIYYYCRHIWPRVITVKVFFPPCAYWGSLVPHNPFFICLARTNMVSR